MRHAKIIYRWTEERRESIIVISCRRAFAEDTELMLERM